LKNSAPVNSHRSIYNFRMISSLENPVYRIYFLSTLGFFTSMSMNIVSSPKLMYYLTDSSALLGITSLVSALPLLSISLFGGVIADRIQKKWIIFACVMGFAIMSLSVALCLESGIISRERSGSYWILLVSSFIQSSLMGLIIPAFAAIVPEIVKREHLMNAVSLNTLGQNVVSLIAPTIAGLLIDKLDYRFVYYAMAGFYLWTAVFTVFLRHTSRGMARGGKILADIQNGFQYVRRDATIWSILVFTTAMVVLGMPFQTLLPIFTDKILKVGATGMGILMSASGAGALAGSFIMAALPNKKRGLMLLGAGLLAGLALIGFAFSTVWSFSITVMVFFGLTVTFRNTLGNALLSGYSNPIYMGRVMSLMNMQWGAMAIVTFFSGVIAETIPVQWVVGVLALALVLTAVFVTTFSPHVRSLD
jgi:MFS family permease